MGYICPQPCNLLINEYTSTFLFHLQTNKRRAGKPTIFPLCCQLSAGVTPGHYKKDQSNSATLISHTKQYSKTLFQENSASLIIIMNKLQYELHFVKQTSYFQNQSKTQVNFIPCSSSTPFCLQPGMQVGYHCRRPLLHWTGKAHP